MTRRTAIASAFAASTALAQTKSSAPAKLWSAEYTASKGPVSLAMFRKRATAPRAGEAPKPVLFLVHGSSMSSRPSFDLTVPGHGDYSIMNTFADYGFDVSTMHH